MAEEPIAAGMSSGRHVIIAGFGVPGRAVADLLAARNESFCVIELNPQTVERCSHIGMRMIAGDVCNEQTLREAGIENARLMVLAVPNDSAVLEAVRLARRLKPGLEIVARCRFISSGMEAHRRGADRVIIEEQVVANELTRLLKDEVDQLAES